MIIWVLATKDKHITEGAEQAAAELGAAIYQGHTQSHYHKAGIKEEIKIFAHGNEHEIGEESGSPSWKPEELAILLYDKILPDGYEGKLCIDACGSGVMDGARRTYVDRLYHHLLHNVAKNFKGTVWGYGGNVSGFGKDEVVEAAGGDLPAGWMEIKARDRV